MSKLKSKKPAAKPKKRAAKSGKLALKSKTAAVAAAPKPRRHYRGGVRNKILALLSNGPQKRAELLKRGGFSKASLYLHLRAMQDQGLVVADNSNRVVQLASQSKASGRNADKIVVTAETVAEVRTPSVLVKRGETQELHEALGAVLGRLAPIERAQDKLLVLDQLARTTPTPVSAVLRSLMEDVLRIASIQSEEVIEVSIS